MDNQWILCTFRAQCFITPHVQIPISIVDRAVCIRSSFIRASPISIEIPSRRHVFGRYVCRKVISSWSIYSPSVLFIWWAWSKFIEFHWIQSKTYYSIKIWHGLSMLLIRVSLDGRCWQYDNRLDVRWMER